VFQRIYNILWYHDILLVHLPIITISSRRHLARSIEFMNKPITYWWLILFQVVQSDLQNVCLRRWPLTSDSTRLSDPRYWSAHLGMLTQGSAKHVAEIQRIVVHEYYNSYTFDYDIALLQLKKPWPPSLSPLVQPVCLPPSSHTVTGSHRCIVTGWGYRSEKGEQHLGSSSVTFILWYSHEVLLRVCLTGLVYAVYSKHHISNRNVPLQTGCSLPFGKWASSSIPALFMSSCSCQLKASQICKYSHLSFAWSMSILLPLQTKCFPHCCRKQRCPYWARLTARRATDLCHHACCVPGSLLESGTPAGWAHIWLNHLHLYEWMWSFESWCLLFKCSFCINCTFCFSGRFRGSSVLSGTGRGSLVPDWHRQLGGRLWQTKPAGGLHQGQQVHLLDLQPYQLTRQRGSYSSSASRCFIILSLTQHNKSIISVLGIYSRAMFSLYVLFMCYSGRHPPTKQTRSALIYFNSNEVS